MYMYKFLEKTLLKSIPNLFQIYQAPVEDDAWNSENLVKIFVNTNSCGKLW